MFPDWLGPKKRPKSLEGRQKVNVRAPAQRPILLGVTAREPAIAEPVVVRGLRVVSLTRKSNAISPLVS